LKTLNDTIAKEKKALPANYTQNINISDSGILSKSMPNRNKTIEDIENDIEVIRAQIG
jgi:hypothetical protein